MPIVRDFEIDYSFNKKWRAVFAARIGEPAAAYVSAMPKHSRANHKYTIQPHIMPTFLRALTFILLFLIAGCTPNVQPQNAIQADIEAQTQAFYNAVVHKDASKVYAIMSPVYQSRYSEQEFKSHFDSNYEIFVEYAERIRNDVNAYEIYAQAENDPCGTIRLGLDENGSWKIAQSGMVFLSADDIKERLLAVLRTNEFSLAMQEYMQSHPEFTDYDVRSVLRRTKMGEVLPQHVNFYGNQATIDVPETARIYMSCTGNAWRLERCSLLH